MIQFLTQKLISGEELEPSEIEQAAEEMMEGIATPVQVASFLTALHMRGERLEDVAAFAQVLRRHAVPFHRQPGIVLDTCGTGGDHSGTFNISTAAAIVAASAGVRVAKHGNRSMTSRCGSVDVLQQLGVNIDCDNALMERALDQIGICFLFAQKYHHSMRHVAHVRRELGFRTVFNLLGPLANPAGASHQLMGVFRRDLVEVIAKVLARLGTSRALVVHGDDGLDEITTTSASYVAEVNGGRVRTYVIAPQDFGLEPASITDIVGGDATRNAEIIEQVFAGEPGPYADIVVFNAGAAIYTAEKADSIAQGIAFAREAIASGDAREKLNELRDYTHTRLDTLPPVASPQGEAPKQ